MKKKRVLVLHSGGMDSTVCLYKAHADGHEVHSLGIDYGQRLSVEMMYAKLHCAKLGIPRQVISLNWQKPAREIPLGRSIEEMTSAVSPAFLPGRNVVFLSLASAHAAGLAVDEIHTGLNCIEFSGYPDCTPEFFDAFGKMVSLAIPGGAILRAPLLMLSKPQIAQMAKDLEVGEHDTWSCYRPQITINGIQICGQCDACRLHGHAWRAIEN